MGHERPLRLPVSNSLETPCSVPSEGNMALPPSSLRKGDAGPYVKKPSLSLTVLSLCAEARGLLSQTRLWPNRWQRQHTSPRTWDSTMHPGYVQFAWANNQTNRSITKRTKTSKESNHSSEASGATPGGCARAHPPEWNATEKGRSSCKKSATKASKRVLTLPSSLGGYCRGP
jgi:hypothetical protein